MRRIFGELKMGWPAVLLFSVAAGIYTGLVMLVPVLKGTSFQDIGISYEWWVVFAVIIVVNCKKCGEAMLKCFIFFLISQPLVYLTEVLFGKLSMDMAVYYYKNIWFPITLLVLPGGLIAFFCKKQSILGGIILGLGNTIQAAMGAQYLGSAIKAFPYHLLTAVFCFVSVFIMTFCIQKKKVNRWIALLVPLVLCLAAFFYLRTTGRIIFREL